MHSVTAADVADLARGAAVLGSGGGGNPYMGQLMAEHALAEHGPVTVLGLEEVPASSRVVAVMVMGTPTVFYEKMLAGDEMLRAVRAVSRAAGQAPTHLMPGEIGGVNATIPLVPAAESGLSLVDGDFMGRAFPELSMLLPALAGLSLAPLALTDEKGNVLVLEATDMDWGERIARVCSVAMGGTAVVAYAPLSPGQLRGAMAHGTVGRAQALGKAIRLAREDRRDPVEAARRVLSGVTVFRGKVVDVDGRPGGGFLWGRAVVEGTGPDTGTELVVRFQNEYLLATRGGRALVTTPNLICVLEEEGAQPVPADALRYGLRVAVVGAPCDEAWRSPQGLEITGPGHFGYDHPYAPLTAPGPADR
ncbi:DUF917 domain-containing protein [Streptomyces sp. NPDC005876]|uniref:DUF917 domain-containing protein n=1 Tax=Streptomyces sp. NPDC005876 TaxID=3157076 RepID=UPI003407E946